MASLQVLISALFALPVFSHGIPRHGVLQGALTLARTLPYAPAGVHLAVVDPEVGARRRAVALRTGEEERLLVGPDNGLLMPAAEIGRASCRERV